MSPEPTAAALRDTVDDLNHCIDEIRRHVREIPGVVDGLLDVGNLPPAVQQFIVQTAAEAVRATVSLLDLTDQLIAGAAAPAWFFDYAYRWESVRGITSGTTGALNPDLMPAAGVWSGDAAAAYDRAAGPQRDATERLTTLITKIDASLNVCGRAGVAFYFAVAAAIAILLFDWLAALFTAATGIGVPIALVELVGGTAGVAAVIILAVGSLTAVLAFQAGEMAALHGEAVDGSAFPDGHWPDPITRTYSDATVTDGDADWSLQD